MRFGLTHAAKIKTACRPCHSYCRTPPRKWNGSGQGAAQLDRCIVGSAGEVFCEYYSVGNAHPNPAKIRIGENAFILWVKIIGTNSLELNRSKDFREKPDQANDRFPC